MTRRQTAPGGAIGIAGAGRMAQALGRLLFQHGQPIVVMASRSRSKARRAARFVGPSVRAVDLSQLPAQADRLIVAVADDALFEVAGTLAEAGMDAGMIIHTSGVWGPEVFSRLMEQGVSCASMHPLQTVANPKQGVEKLPGSTFAVFNTAPMPVVMPQPSKQTFSSGALSLILATAISGSTVYSLKVEVPM